MARKLKDADIRAQIRAATEGLVAEDQAGPRAVAAHYDRNTERLIVELHNGSLFAVPTALVEGLESASADQIAQVEVAPGGDLHWEALDVDHHTSFLLRGLFGSRAWMSEIGRTLGQHKSEAKSRASRINGRKGGRPPRSRKNSRTS